MESSPSGSGLSQPLKPFFLNVCNHNQEKLSFSALYNSGGERLTTALVHPYGVALYSLGPAKTYDFVKDRSKRD